MAQSRNCYQLCNQRYTAMQPQRLFCKKGCDSEQQSMQACRIQTCNKICIKSESEEQKLVFKFLYRAPADSGPCLTACIYGCNVKNISQTE